MDRLLLARSSPRLSQRARAVQSGGSPKLKALGGHLAPEARGCRCASVPRRILAQTSAMRMDWRFARPRRLATKRRLPQQPARVLANAAAWRIPSPICAAPAGQANSSPLRPCGSCCSPCAAMTSGAAFCTPCPRSAPPTRACYGTCSAIRSAGTSARGLRPRPRGTAGFPKCCSLATRSGSRHLAGPRPLRPLARSAARYVEALVNRAGAALDLENSRRRAPYEARSRATGPRHAHYGLAQIALRHQHCGWWA